MKGTRSARGKPPKAMPPSSKLTKTGEKMATVGKGTKMKTGMKSQYKPRQAGGSNY